MKTQTAKLYRSLDRIDRTALRFYESATCTVLILALAIFDGWIVYNIIRHP